MSKTKRLEQPSEGGMYYREKDGSLITEAEYLKRQREQKAKPKSGNKGA